MMGLAEPAPGHQVAADMAEVLECKAAWRLGSQGGWEGWCGELRCSGTQEGAKGSGPSADRVVQAESGQPFCCQDDYSCLMLAGHCQPQLLDIQYLPPGCRAQWGKECC